MDTSHILTYLHTFVITHWTVILTYLATGGGISVVLQFLKRLRKWESSAWIELALGIMTSLTAITNYVISNYASSPLPTIFGNYAPKILVASLIVHRLLVSPLFKLVEQRFIPYIKDLNSAVAQLKAEKVIPAAITDAKTIESTTTFES
jgi:hypothetical protein